MNSPAHPVVVITGATGATGKAAALAFAEQGASLALLSHDLAKLQALAAELNLPAGRVLIHAADLRDPEAMRAAEEAVAARFGRTDILLHLVGGWAGGTTLPETPASDLETMLNQHAWTTFYLLQSFTPGMIQRGWGRVIVVSSPQAVQPSAKMSAYAAGKAAQEALMQTFAQEASGSGVTANMIHVRAIDAKAQGKGTSLDEIVSAMLYLCSEPASRLNGARLPLY